jgi:hypothetical protein
MSSFKCRMTQGPGSTPAPLVSVRLMHHGAVILCYSAAFDSAANFAAWARRGQRERPQTFHAAFVPSASLCLVRSPQTLAESPHSCAVHMESQHV